MPKSRLPRFRARFYLAPSRHATDPIHEIAEDSFGYLVVEFEHYLRTAFDPYERLSWWFVDDLHPGGRPSDLEILRKVAADTIAQFAQRYDTFDTDQRLPYESQPLRRLADHVRFIQANPDYVRPPEVAWQVFERRPTFVVSFRLLNSQGPFAVVMDYDRRNAIIRAERMILAWGGDMGAIRVDCLAAKPLRMRMSWNHLLIGKAIQDYLSDLAEQQARGGPVHVLSPLYTQR